MSKKSTKRTVVTLLLDRSGSMGGIKNETIEGYNSYICGLREDPKVKIDYTFLQFDSISVDKVLENVPIKDVPLLTAETFQPRGATPLLDAAFETIEAVESAVRRAKDDPQVVICIQTDGQENKSRSHTWAELSKLIEAKQEAGWQFTFLGAGINAYDQAARLSINTANTISYGTDMGATRAAFSSLSANTVAYASTGNAASINFSSIQKNAAGDRFEPQAVKDNS